MDVKTCFRCQVEKPLHKFSRDRRLKDGYAGTCKLCIRTKPPRRRVRRGTPKERFADQVDTEGPQSPTADGPCWLWTGAAFTDGYGRLTVDGKSKRVHRLAWEWEHGEIPEDGLICHECDTPLCVRPSHLFLGSPADNMHDRDSKGRAMRGQRHVRAKLSRGDIPVIRARCAAGEPYLVIARDCGVSDATIRNIAIGKNWKHV
jgi:hypothetical protein